ncbi:MAG: cell wall hydrolase [Rhizobiales bacterium]|nr:cell wall hydrolase [Hyphomicrobiales bacterium]
MRQRPQRPTILFRLILAGGVLAVSSGTIGYQDASDAVAYLADLGSRPKVASFTDPSVTGAIPRAIRKQLVNRDDKSDFIVVRRAALPKKKPDGLTAGVLNGGDLFAAPTTDGLPKTAFLQLPDALPVVMASAVAPAGIVAAAKPVVLPRAKPAIAVASATTPVQMVSAYANSDDDVAAKNAPFDAVINKKPIDPKSFVLVPKVDANHAWVNNPLPPSAHTEAQIKCLATAIYFEARGEPQEGQVAVAQVVLNRVKNPAYPGTICGVVYQNKNMRYRCQFSFACDRYADRVTDKGSWKEADQIAHQIVNDQKGMFLADVGTSTHYHAVYVRPRWARTMKKMDKIGRHVFYKTYGGGWS